MAALFLWRGHGRGLSHHLLLPELTRQSGAVDDVAAPRPASRHSPPGGGSVILLPNTAGLTLPQAAGPWRQRLAAAMGLT